MFTDNTPEIELVLRTAHLDIDETSKNAIKALLSNPALDWDKVLNVADYNKVLPLVYRQILAIDPESMPGGEFRVKLDGWIRYIEQHNKLLRQELKEIIQQLYHLKIAFLCFKGLILSEVAYGSLDKREFFDLDFLFHKEDIRTVRAALKQRGYKEYLPIADHELDMFQRYHFANLFRYTDPKTNMLIEIDIHWSLLPKFWPLTIDKMELWSRSVQYDFDDIPARVFSVEDTLVYLAIHNAKEHWWRYRMVTDVLYWIQAHPGMNWDTVMQQARAARSTKMLLLALSIVSHYAPIELPEPIKQAMNDKKIQVIADNRITALYQNERKDVDVFRLSKDSFYYFSIFESWLDVVRYWFRMITLPQTRHLRLILLPARLRFMYYPIKLVHDYIYLPLWQIMPMAIREKLKLMVKNTNNN